MIRANALRAHQTIGLVMRTTPSSVWQLLTLSCGTATGSRASGHNAATTSKMPSRPLPYRLWGVDARRNHRHTRSGNPAGPVLAVTKTSGPVVSTGSPQILFRVAV
jgi:hypothetical protein